MNAVEIVTTDCAEIECVECGKAITPRTSYFCCPGCGARKCTNCHDPNGYPCCPDDDYKSVEVVT